MPRSLTLGRTAIPAGSRQFVIDNLPNNSDGYELTFGVSAEWIAAQGPLFEILLELALDGTFREWARVSMNGGPVVFRGQTLDVWKMEGTWPGEHDGSQNPFGRKVLRGTDLRITLTAHQPFAVDSASFRTV